MTERRRTGEAPRPVARAFIVTALLLFFQGGSAAMADNGEPAQRPRRQSPGPPANVESTRGELQQRTIEFFKRVLKAE